MPRRAICRTYPSVAGGVALQAWTAKQAKSNRIISPRTRDCLVIEGRSIANQAFGNILQSGKQ
jgi:hypothetical protein